MAIGRTNYTADAVAAARSVLLELTHLLGQYRDDIVVVGGWVPELLLPQSQGLHIGSTDVDLALNHRTLQEAGYRTIKELLPASVRTLSATSMWRSPRPRIDKVSCGCAAE